jgi:hypothetical protein
VDSWKADIISMSFGYRTEQSTIREAISTAMYSRKGNIIFFAAAGNRGANEVEMYPASSQNVISVRATDHVGTFVGEYNPAPLPLPFSERALFYGTLGVDAPYDYPSDKRMSGCSIAAPIMAGMAALIMECAAYHGANERSLAYLRRSNGLEAFFRNKGVSQGNGRMYIHLEALRTPNFLSWVNDLDTLMSNMVPYM